MIAPSLLRDVRGASRTLVREFGLMNRHVAGTDLSLSAVHAIIEIGYGDGVSASALGQRLLLEKSTVSRLLRSLIERGEVHEARSTRDSRMKTLHLTGQGRRTLHRIDHYAESRVRDALGTLDDSSQQTVLGGLKLYSGALQAARGGGDPAPDLAILPGYSPTLVGRIVELLLTHMHANFGFGRAFESRISRDLAEFMERVDRPLNQTWRALVDGRIVGSISIDGEDLGAGVAHLRWFVVDANCRGLGLGRALLRAALDFCDANQQHEIQLWTVKGLDVARSLYLASGFQLVEEYTGDQWGSELVEHKYVRVCPGIAQAE